ncbi:winged helix-turn-helix domain-containing tetratricopeptide repeat protein [Luteimonas pelagia]
MTGSYAFDHYVLTPSRHELRRDGVPLTLEPKAIAVLGELVTHPGELLGRERLLDVVWGHRHVTPGVLNRLVMQLRRALEDDARAPRFIQTVHSLGYRFIAPVRSGDADQVDAGGPAGARLPQATSHGAIPLAVLPFRDLSGAPGEAWFSDGITEDIITALSRWRMLAVRSRSASFRHRGSDDFEGVARALGVRYIVEGSVRRLGDDVRIGASLIDADSGNTLWAEKFDQPASGIFAVQDSVVATIVSTLVGRVQASDVERARRKPPPSLAAYECVLEGNALHWYDASQRAEATRLFEKAIALDPDYGLAHALLAVMRYVDWYDAPKGDDTSLEAAYVLARRGVEIDPGDSACHSLLAQVHRLRGEWALCEQQIHRAIELNPTNQWNTAAMGMMQAYLGRPEAGDAWFQRTRRIDPYFDEPWFWREQGIARLVRGDDVAAVSMFDRMTVRHYRVDAFRAATLALKGDQEAARAVAADCLARRPGFSSAQFLSKMPFANPMHRDRIARGLRLAGLPG